MTSLLSSIAHEKYITHYHLQPIDWLAVEDGDGTTLELVENAWKSPQSSPSP